MKTAVVYNSKYGAARQYGEWIAEALNADLIDGKGLKVAQLMPYDLIVYGGGIYSGGIYRLDFMKKHARKELRQKVIVCYGVGISVGHDENQIQADEINFSDELKGMPCFYLTGRFQPSEIRGFDRAVIKLTKKLLQGGTGAYADELRDAFANGSDLIDREQILPLVQYVRELEERMQA
jgi:menaquinone-dependent protoporphyrinogen IX oxidase